MNDRRFIALVLSLLIGVAACAPARAEQGTAAIRHGKHLSRVVDQALVVRNSRETRPVSSGQRRSGFKAWSAGSQDSLAPVTLVVHTFPARPVDTLPGHWGALHLTI